MATKSGELRPRPYARLMTMLSDQLIKNNVVALTELAKNSYDADATWVQIRIGNMSNFGKDGLKSMAKPFVEIEDDGDGMSFETIRDCWMNPASPGKFIRRQEDRFKTRKGRIIQGEKGIGRYAVFQIGKKVEIFSRERIGTNKGGREVNLITDLSEYTDELLSKKKSPSPEKPLFFDQLLSKYHLRDEPIRIKPGKISIEGRRKSRKNHGTLIMITELNYEWTYSNVRRTREILARMQSPFSKTDFEVSIIFDDEEILVFEDYSIGDALEEALLEMSGSVNTKGICRYSLNGEKGALDLVDNLRQDAVKENKAHFFDDQFNRIHNPRCGPFEFRFYVYDLPKIDDPTLRRYIREHRIYIYRDGIRVYPYGDSDNDWIKLDIYRGVIRAAAYLSNDQLIGYVTISSQKNPGLRDKTNREGLLEQGTAYEDLRLLTLSALNFLHNEYQRFKLKPPPKHHKARTSALYLQTEKVQQGLDNFKRHLDETQDQEGMKNLAKLTEDYYKEREIYRGQIEIVEDLAGVGIAVDATSHDLMLVMNRAVERMNEIYVEVHSEDVDIEKLKNKTEALEGQLTFMRSLLVGIQPLFRSSRRKNKELEISNIVKTVQRYYETPLRGLDTKIDIREIGTPLIVTSSEGVLLQLFINLVDNSIYWLKISKTQEPKIEVLIDGDHGYVIFADNGPGVEEKYIDYIFEPFFSRKGIQGRGLGLYIARQLTDRYDYDLYYLEEKDKWILPGANFKIDFFEQEE